MSPAKGEIGANAATTGAAPLPDVFLFMFLLTVEGHNGFFLLISVQSMLPTCRTFALLTPNSLRMLRMDPFTRTRLDLQPTDTGRAADRIFVSAAEAACSLSHARESSLILGSARCACLVKTRVLGTSCGYLLGTSCEMCAQLYVGRGRGGVTVVAGDEPVLSPHEATTLAVGVFGVLALLAS